LKLRPGDATATLTMLDNLRKLAPDDAGVKALRDSIYDPRRAITNTIGMKLELIPAGEFMMGSTHDDKDASDAEKPQHRVRITRPFYLGVTEVTRGQFRRFVDDAGYRTEAEKDGIGGFGLWVYDPKYNWQNLGFDQTDEHPVVNVSWNDAVAFAAWLSRKEGGDLPAADRGRMGIRLPCWDNDQVFQRRRSRVAGNGRKRRGRHGQGEASELVSGPDLDDRGAGRICLHGSGGPV
jgi:Sulfatase-modifying factor enzyme 1